MASRVARGNSKMTTQHAASFKFCSLLWCALFQVSRIYDMYMDSCLRMEHPTRLLFKKSIFPIKIAKRELFRKIGALAWAELYLWLLVSFLFIPKLKFTRFTPKLHIGGRGFGVFLHVTHCTLRSEAC